MHNHEQKTEHKSFASPEEVRNFPNDKAEILTVGGAEVGRLVFKPGGSSETSRWPSSTGSAPVTMQGEPSASRRRRHDQL
jgi:hypothetical protein